MPQKAATPRTTRNSLGLRETTPTAGRTSRESSVTSDDGVHPTSTPLRRSQRSRESSVTSDDGQHPARTPTTRSRRSRESSVTSDDGNRRPATPKPRSRRSRSRSVESTTNVAACPTSNQTTATTARPQTQLPLPPLPESAPTTPKPTRTSVRTFQGAQAAPALTPIKEESPAPARFDTPYIGELENTVTSAHIDSSIIEQTSPQASAEVHPQLSPVHIASVEETAAQPSQAVTSVAEQSDSTPVPGPTAIVANPTTVVANTTAPLSLHQVGLSFSLRPVTPLHYNFLITDNELQSLIHKECDESEVEDPDHAWIKVRRERTKARRQHKLKWRYNQLRRTFALPEDFSEATHPLITGEDPDQYTENYGSLKNKEGHAFGARLLRAIKDDHERRGCTCPLPQIYRSRAAAEAGQGTFRFFRHFKRPDFDNVWVFMRKDDWHWHCTCDSKALSDFAIWVRRHKAEKFADEVAQRDAEEQLLREEQEERAKRLSRKRKAQDDEAELGDSVTIRVVNGPCLPGAAALRRRIARLKSSTRLLRSVRLAGSNLFAGSVRSMGGVLSTAAIIMGTSVKHFLSRVGAQRKSRAYVACLLRRALLTFV